MQKGKTHATVPQMSVTSTLLDQAHNAIDRKLFAMQGFHHPGESQQALVRGLAHLYNLVPYQWRAQHVGQCGVEVEGGLPCSGKYHAPCGILRGARVKGPAS